MEKGNQLLGYAQGEIAGHPSTDVACFSQDKNNCINDLQFLSVVKGKNLGALKGGGLIGLAPVPDNSEQ
jgi:hypothetical protein